ncbi:hypothetical protein F5X68DRAFT_207081, partial [Plectosphaerella plurivora]
MSRWVRVVRRMMLAMGRSCGLRFVMWPARKPNSRGSPPQRSSLHWTLLRALQLASGATAPTALLRRVGAARMLSLPR